MRLAISMETAHWRYFRMLVTDWAILSDFRMAKKSTVHVKPTIMMNFANLTSE